MSASPCEEASLRKKYSMNCAFCDTSIRFTLNMRTNIRKYATVSEIGVHQQDIISNILAAIELRYY